MDVLRHRWFWISTVLVLALVALLLAADFVIAGIGWISWAQAVAVAALVGGVVGFGFGWLSAWRSTNELWLVATAVSGCLFALVVAQYLLTIAVTSRECSPPEVVANCFDEHAAAVGGFGALGGSMGLAAELGAAAMAGSRLRRCRGQSLLARRAGIN